MSLALDVVVVLASAIAMEGVATALHRFVMHGALGWGWHRSHHAPRTGAFEANDFYAVVFTVLSGALIASGMAGLWPLRQIGIGLMLYGIAYFVVHDGLVHRRWPLRHVPRTGYLKRLVQAHRLHHAVDGRDGCVSFGFLYAPPTSELRQRLRRGRPLRPPHRAGSHGTAARARRPGPHL